MPQLIARMWNSAAVVFPGLYLAHDKCILGNWFRLYSYITESNEIPWCCKHIKYTGWWKYEDSTFDF